jgi:alpha-1,4-digalacturonate transport system substrate-binding protein
MTFKRLHPIALAAGLALVAGVAQAGEIRVMCYQDGVECDVTAEQAKRFEAQNPGTKVVIDVVPYKTIVEQLPVQLAAGEGPDIARVTNLGGLSQYYMDISANLKAANIGTPTSAQRPVGWRLSQTTKASTASCLS